MGPLKGEKTMDIKDVMKLENGKAVDFEATIDKIFPPKRIAKNGSSFTIQEIGLKDGTGTINLSTLEELPQSNVGKKAHITGTTSHWKGRDKILHRSLKGKLEIISNGGNGKRLVETSPKTNGLKKPAFPKPVSEFEQRDLWIATQSSMKVGAELLSAVSPLCKSMDELPSAADKAMEITLHIASELVKTIYEIRAENSVSQLRHRIAEQDIPEEEIREMLAGFGVNCLCELTEEQRTMFLKQLQELQHA